MENLFGKHLHLVSPFPLRYMKHPVWNAAWCPGCLAAPPVLKAGRIACSKYKTGWSRASGSGKPALMYKWPTLTFTLRGWAASPSSPWGTVLWQCKKATSIHGWTTHSSAGLSRSSWNGLVNPAFGGCWSLGHTGLWNTFLEKTQFKDGVQESWSALSIFVQTVYYWATSTELFCIINL